MNQKGLSDMPIDTGLTVKEEDNRLLAKMLAVKVPKNEIARRFDVNPRTIYRKAKLPEVQKMIRDKLVDVEKFRANRAEIYSFEQMESLRLQGIIRKEKFTLKEIKGLNTKEAVDLYAELRKDQKDKHEQERLELDKSTENVAVIVMAIKDLKKRSTSSQ